MPHRFPVVVPQRFDFTPFHAVALKPNIFEHKNLSVTIGCVTSTSGGVKCGGESFHMWSARKLATLQECWPSLQPEVSSIGNLINPLLQPEIRF